MFQGKSSEKFCDTSLHGHDMVHQNLIRGICGQSLYNKVTFTVVIGKA